VALRENPSPHGSKWTLWSLGRCFGSGSSACFRQAGAARGNVFHQWPSALARPHGGNAHPCAKRKRRSIKADHASYRGRL